MASKLSSDRQRLLVNDDAQGYKSFLGAKHEKHALICGFRVPLLAANVFFALSVVIGQTGQNITLPLFVDELNNTVPYFVLLFAAASFVLFFGVWLFYIQRFTNSVGPVEYSFPHLNLFLVGFASALNGLLVVFSSPGSRTPVYLQAILLNFSIPFTIFARWLVLNKKASWKQLASTSLVLVGLFISLIPTVFNMETDQVSSSEMHGAAKILWPLCFMVGFTPLAMMNILGEKWLKENFKGKVPLNIIYWMFWTSFYQALTILALFWTDIIPSFGMSNSLHDLGVHIKNGFECIASYGGCTASSTVRGFLFVAFYLVTNIASAKLLRYAEGASWVAIVSALVSPLGVLFWTLFTENPFQWHPEWIRTTWYTFGGVALIVPGILLYHRVRDESLELNDDDYQPLNEDEESLESR